MGNRTNGRCPVSVPEEAITVFNNGERLHVGASANTARTWIGREIEAHEAGLAAGAAAERSRWIAAVKASNCLATCDDDCEHGPVHCWFVHSLRREPGWHSAEACPFADLLAGDQ